MNLWQSIVIAFLYFTELLSSLKRMDLSDRPLLMVENAVKDIREAFFQGDEISTSYLFV